MKIRLVLVALLVTGCTYDGESAASARRVGTCVEPAGAPTWARSEAEFLTSTTYGSDGGPELGDVWGLAASLPGDVYVFDAGNTEVLRLTPDLERVAAVGGSGRGPGEFTYQRALHGDWLAVSDSIVVVLDYRGTSEFSLSGDFLRFRTSALPFTDMVREVALLGADLAYASDVIDLDSGDRRLETWFVDMEGHRRLARSDPMPSLPRWQGRLVRGEFADQAEPLWATGPDCVFVSDGSSPWIVRFDPRSGAADTLDLPLLDRPARSPADWARLETRRRSARRVGINAGSRDMVPTAATRWSAMIVDPEGYVWMEPWRPFSQISAPLEAVVLNPATEETVTVTVSRFPDAFLPGGAMVSLVREPTFGRPVLFRQDRRPDEDT